ncbi:hypothetical protein bpuCAU1_001681 (plasmid) [Borrelia puertoricensis]|uniref:hypothetical protein n=1 Tax=Borrelia puertoricensis TaxID=2756107 RepID=UPI003EB99393
MELRLLLKWFLKAKEMLKQGILRNTVDTGLKSISDALATVIQEDKSADSTIPAETATGSQQ